VAISLSVGDQAMEITSLDGLSNWFWNSNQPTALIGIALGIIFKYVYDYYLRYTKSKRKSNIKFDRKGFFLTVLLSAFLSVLLYSGFLSKVADLKSDLLVLSVAAQTGFFWQTIISDFLKAETA
jgi:putative flippase GtrA